MTDYRTMAPSEVRSLIRRDMITTNTSGMCAGYAQANLVVLPRDLAFDFLLFAQKNPYACPVLEVCDSRFTSEIADRADIARDLPRYRVYEYGEMTGEYLTWNTSGETIS